MRSRPRSYVVLLAGLLAVASSGALWSSQTETAGKILFAVWAPQKGKQPEGPILDPIGILSGSALSKLPAENYDKPEGVDDEMDRFSKIYYAPGKEYPLLYGGSQLGTAKVVKEAGLGCVSLSAIVKTSVEVPNNQYSLAIGSLAGLGLHENWRRKPTSEEETDFSRAAATVLEKNGVQDVSSAKITITNLRATRLGEKRPTALVGTIATYKTQDAGHNLFLVMEQRDAQWETVIATYRKMMDLEDHTDDIEENFVDQIDLAGDKTDEVITIRGYYESWDYAVYKLEKGLWSVVYQGGGGGC